MVAWVETRVPLSRNMEVGVLPEAWRIFIHEYFFPTVFSLFLDFVIVVGE